MQPPQTPRTLQRRLGVFSATTLIVGSMIGSGIFIAPSIMASYVATPGIWIGLWLVGGALTLLGALAYGELCAMMPQAGGQYVFLREAFGPTVAFLYGWTLFLVIQTGFNAAVAIAFAKFLGGVGLRVGENDVVLAVGGHTLLSRAQIVAVVVIAVLTWVNDRGGVRGGGARLERIHGAQGGRGGAAGGRRLRQRQGVARKPLRVSGGTGLGPKGLEMGLLAAMGVAMSKALFAYDAWNTVTFTAEEVREPERNLPRALVAGTIVTTLAYTAACAVYLYVLPIVRMGGVEENRVAHASMKRWGRRRRRPCTRASSCSCREVALGLTGVTVHRTQAGLGHRHTFDALRPGATPARARGRHDRDDARVRPPAPGVYLYVLPIDRMGGVEENRVASEVAGIVLGPAGVTLISIAILVSTFGCVNGLILGGARVLFAMSRDGLFFRAAGRVDPVTHTPRGALLLQGVWSAVLALTGSYDRLLTYVTFASLAFNALTVVGLIVLRRTQPGRARPYRTWGYPVTPAVYLLGASFFLVYIFVGDPADSLAGVGLVALGFPAYWWLRRRAPVAA